MRRRTSPVQQWVDSLPSPAKSSTSRIGAILRQQSLSVDSESASIPECSVEQILSEKENHIRHSNMTVSTPIAVPNSPSIAYPCVTRLARDPSFQSDSSHCSSVESLLELRKADPEAVLLSLGFGGCAGSPQEQGPLSRIPKRFLQPSKLKGIAINDFVRHQQETNESLDSTSLGYRGLTGSPYVAPSEIVQKIMQRLREHENHEFDAFGCRLENGGLPQQQEGRLSVLSPDNRQFLERPRSKSPDMRNKRMIIGQRSFAFGNDGDLIEIKPSASLHEGDEPFDPLYNSKDEADETASHADDGSSSDSSYDESPAPRRRPSLLELRSNHENRDSTETVIPARSSSQQRHSPESPRRSSEGSSCAKSPAPEEGRRFSDGVMESIRQSDDDAAATTRRSLKRQSRLHDEASPSRDEVESVDEEDACCYGRSRHSCWREVEKVRKKNKKLEEVVVKSRREMAEIRNMLSSVLSIRMEPGF